MIVKQTKRKILQVRMIVSASKNEIKQTGVRAADKASSSYLKNPPLLPPLIGKNSFRQLMTHQFAHTNCTSVETTALPLIAELLGPEAILISGWQPFRCKRESLDYTMSNHPSSTLTKRPLPLTYGGTVIGTFQLEVWRVILKCEVE